MREELSVKKVGVGSWSERACVSEDIADLFVSWMRVLTSTYLPLAKDLPPYKESGSVSLFFIKSSCLLSTI